jgi:hypothetical protein
MKRKVIIISLLLAIFAIIFCAIPIMNTGPQVLDCITYSSLTFSANAYVREEDQQDIAVVQVENTDDATGNFTVFFFGFEPLLGNSSMIAILPLDAGQAKIAECAGEFIDDWHYYVISGTKRTVSQWQIGNQRVTLLYWLLHH